MYPTLYKKDSKGNIQVWEIEVEDKNGQGHIKISSGKLDGRRIVKERVVRSGKNIGKSNETTPVEQAQAEAQSAWQKKKDKDYYESVEEARNAQSVLPMLAHRFDQRGHDIIYPCLVQPKLDGVRCMVYVEDGELVFMSRGGKRYDAMLQHTDLCDELKKIIKNDSILDGELYHHGWSLQRITSAAKKYKEDTLDLQFWMFDYIPDEYKDWGNMRRWAVLITRAEKCVPRNYAKLTKTRTVKEKSFIQKLHDEYVLEGYEGIIIRNAEAPYIFGKRSKDLQKYKEFLEDEFKIVDTYCETNTINGVTLNSICFRCETSNGEVFETRPRGTLEHRAKMWEDRDSYIGKMLTVRYQALTDPNVGNGREVPQFPVGIVIRDYE